MNTTKKRFLNDEQGQAILPLGIAFIILLFLAGIVIAGLGFLTQFLQFTIVGGLSGFVVSLIGSKVGGIKKKAQGFKVNKK